MSEMEKNLERLLDIIQVVPTNEQIAALKSLLEDIHMDGYAEAQALYDRESW